VQVREGRLTGGVQRSPPMSDEEQRCWRWSRERWDRVSQAGSSNDRSALVHNWATAVMQMETSRDSACRSHMWTDMQAPWLVYVIIRSNRISNRRS
jgi:hypothetical protein